MSDTSESRRTFIKLFALGATGMALGTGVSRAISQTLPPRPPRRFIVDSHQHYQDAPDYIERLVTTYRPRNAMACVLTPMSGFEVVKKAATDYPDTIIPYGFINVDEPRALWRFRSLPMRDSKG